MFLTFDIGTSGLKTALVDESGNLLAVHTCEYTPASPHPGWAEMAAETYWQAAVTGTRGVIRKSGIDASRVSAIGFSSQGQTFIPVARNGEVLRDAIVWVDMRAQALVDRWESDWLPASKFRSITGYPWLATGLTIFGLAWLSENEPRVLDAWKFLCLPDFMIYRLTGLTVTDFSTALSTGLYNLRERTWEPELVTASGISIDQLPTVAPPGTMAGRLTSAAAAQLGVPSGIPVCLGANDQLVGAIGAGNVSAGIVTETTGTALALVATTDDILDSWAVCMARHAVENKYYALSFATTSAIILKWFRDLVDEDADYESLFSGVEAIPPGSDGLVVLPHFAGATVPHFNPNARGAIVGLNLGHTRAHIVRAIMEACCFLLKDCLEPVLEQNVEIKSVRSLGGAARSNMWLQMKADLLGIPVERPACSDAASLGAAMLASIGAGQFQTLEEAVGAWYRSSRTFEPNEIMRVRYLAAYELYRNTYTKLYG